MANENPRLKMLREQKFQEIYSGIQNGTLKRSTKETSLSAVQSEHVAQLTKITDELKQLIKNVPVSNQQWPFGFA